jgi:hypothetical protein
MTRKKKKKPSKSNPTKHNISLTWKRVMDDDDDGELSKGGRLVLY